MIRAIVGLLVFSGCSSDAAFLASGVSSPYGSESGIPTTSATPPTSEPPPQSSALTAGAWDDNLNYEYFKRYLEAFAQTPGAPELTAKERDAAFAVFSQDQPANQDLDVAILFDTTGSMADELAYLTDEVASIAGDIEAAAPNADVRWGLVVYRDRGDRYVSKAFEFTSDLSQLQEDLADQSADGGGDYPEASVDGMRDALDLDWRTASDVARMVFWVADAPHHTNEAKEITEEFRRAVDADVHLYPIAASGTDDLTELTMRSGAQLTGGRYLFLTDDSGIGYDHKEPNIPCYFVTTLRDAMVRMVDIEMSGVYREPDRDEVIREGGDPQNGACTLEDGTEVYPF